MTETTSGKTGRVRADGRQNSRSLVKLTFTLVLSFPEGIRASRFFTIDSFVNPSPSAEISRGPFRAISPRAVHAAIASSALLLSRKEPEREHGGGDSQQAVINQ